MFTVLNVESTETVRGLLVVCVLVLVRCTTIDLK